MACPVCFSSNGEPFPLSYWIEESKKYICGNCGSVLLFVLAEDTHIAEFAGKTKLVMFTTIKIAIKKEIGKVTQVINGYYQKDPFPGWTVKSAKSKVPYAYNDWQL